MSHLFGSVWWFLVTLGVLVTFHEFGHFWVARRCGVRVLKFSVGFGKPLWSRKGKDGVEYAIGAIPLGGYVKFLDAREADNPDYVAGQPGEFNAAPVWQRMAIAAAGPVFNFVFAVFAFWAMLVIGKPDLPAVIAAPQNMAIQAGFAAGDTIVAVDGKPVRSYSPAIEAIMLDAIQHKNAVVDVTDSQGVAHQHTLLFTTLAADTANEKLFDAVGLDPKPQEAYIGEVPAGPAARAGLEAGDRIVKVGERTISNWTDVAPAIQNEATNLPGVRSALKRALAERTRASWLEAWTVLRGAAGNTPHLQITVQRASTPLTVSVTPESSTDGGYLHWLIGIAGRDGRTAVEQYGPLRAIPAALHETWEIGAQTVDLIGKMVTGQVSFKNVHSAITIAEVAHFSARAGIASFLAFLAAISLSLGILNLLPIPILDGGHIVYYLIELIKGKPLSDRALIASQYLGLVLLVTLMSVAFYNDIVARFAG
jgi:regulator of sigma E protease